MKGVPVENLREVLGDVIEAALQRCKTSEEADLVIQSLEEQFGIGTSKTEDRLIEIDYLEKPVDMETFLRDEYYLGIIDSIYPKLVDDLLDLFDPSNCYYLVLLGGSIGWGKSTFTECCMARILYEMSCLKDPQHTYKQAPGSTMFFANVSITHTQAKRVIFEGLKGKIKKSEYFRTVFPYEDFATELRFPRNVLFAAATQSQVIGMNTFAAALDEANFMPVVERSSAARLRGKSTYDQAEIIFTALFRRMETRFLTFGNLPGKLIALSSSQYPDDFLERKMALYKSHRGAFIRSYAVWDTKPTETYGSKKFRVFYSKESGIGRIAGNDEPATEADDVINVPDEFRHDFEVDLDGSLRDLAGRATVSVTPFITKRSKILEMINPNRRHPYSMFETTLRDGGYFLRDVMCQWVKEEDKDGTILFEGFRPKVNPKVKRTIHIDPGITGDACGLCMGHVSGYEERKRVRVVQVIDDVSGNRKEAREIYAEVMAMIYVDFWLRIVPPPHGEIILGDVRHLIYELGQMGFKFFLITMDSYQSKDTQQQLKEKYYNVEELSVDVNPEPYNRLRMAVYENRLNCYFHDFGMKEVQGLERDKKKGKVDHRPGFSKDMADSLAGVVHNCETRKVREPVDPSFGMMESRVDEELERERKIIEDLRR